MRRRKRKSNTGCFLFLALILLLIGYGCYAIWQSDYVQKKFVYTWPYSKEVHQYSAVEKVDPYLAVAVMKNESGFNPEAKSKTGALGLMQIMPETGAWIARTTDFPNFKDKLLLLPELNIKFGCWYLGELEHEFKGNEVLLLAAYNAGRGTVKDWMNDNKWDYDFNDVSKIPFADTRDYVVKVLRDRDKYRALYMNTPIE